MGHDVLYIDTAVSGNLVMCKLILIDFNMTVFVSSLIVDPPAVTVSGTTIGDYNKSLPLKPGPPDTNIQLGCLYVAYDDCILNKNILIFAFHFLIPSQKYFSYVTRDIFITKSIHSSARVNIVFNSP